MAKIYEEISKSIANSAGKTDANLANDANNLGGIPAEDYATKKYIQDYHNTKEAAQKEYINQQDQKTLEEAKEYVNAQIRNQDFSPFAKITDVQAVDEKLSQEIENCQTECENNLKSQIKAVVDDTNANFQDVNTAISTLNSNQNELFQSVSNGKATVAAAITDKGVTTASDASFDTMAGNIRSIQTGGGELDENFVNTSDATATASDILLGKTAYAQGNKVYGTLVAYDTSDATATPYDILTGKTAYTQTGKIEGLLTIDESTGAPSYDIGAVEKIYSNIENKLEFKRLDIISDISFTSSYCNCFGYSSKEKKIKAFANITSTSLNISTIYDNSFEATDSKGLLISNIPLSELNIVTDETNEIVTTLPSDILGIAMSDLSIQYPYMIILTKRSSSSTTVTANIYPINFDNSYYSLDVENKKILTITFGTYYVPPRKRNKYNSI